MNFRSLFRNSRSRSRSRRTASIPPTAARLEQLEDRTLLAGNVTAQFLGQNAFINGDSADNSVQVLVDGGSVVLRGSDGTTINGSTNDFVLAANSSSLPGSLVASLSSGDDIFSVSGITIGRDLFVNGGAGNDLLVTSTTTVGRNLTIWGAGGNDDIVIDDSRVERDVSISGFGGDDDIVIRNSTVVDDLVINGHRGHDVIHLDGLQVGDKSRLAGGAGADNIMIQGASQFADRMRAIGGAGADNIQATGGVIFDGLKRRSFSGFITDTATIDSRITNATTGAIAAAEAAVGASTSSESLTLSVNNTTFSEGAGDGAATLTVTRNSTETSADLVVSLTTNPTGQSKLTLAQSTVTIPAGQVSATVAINAVDDTVPDSDAVITVTASATDFTDATATITVTNDDTQGLTLAAASSAFAEDTGSATTTGSATLIDVTVSRDGDTTSDLTVSLTSSEATRLTVPTVVTIPAGQSQQTFTVSTIPNTLVEGNDTVVRVEAAATASTAAQLELTLVDNDSPTLSAQFSAPTIAENGTIATGQTQLTITRNTPATADLVVSLVSDNTSRLQLSATTLTIPTGATEASISVNGIGNSDVDGDVTIGVTATAADFADGEASIVVLDDDTASLGLAITSGSTVEEDAGAGGVTATVARNTTSFTGDLVVALTVTGDDRIVLPVASVTIPDGQQSVAFSVDVVDNQRVDAAGLVAAITASATGFTGASANVTVVENDTATITLQPASSTIAENDGASATTLRIERNSVSTAETVALVYSSAVITGPTTVSFDVDQSFAVITLAATDNDSFDDNADVVITAQAPGRADVSTTISVTNDDVLSLTTDITSNVSVATVLANVTRDNSFTVTGFTEPGATVQIESDGDGLFDDQSAVAATDGSYSFDIPLIRTTANNGLNAFQVRSVLPTEGVEQISDQILVHLAVGTVIRFGINQDLNQDGNNEFFDVELLDTDAPNTVANFLSYVNDGSYDNLLAHRSPPGFVVQGGSFTVSNSVVSPVATRAPIAGEFNPGNSNIDGTLSMALTGAGPDSGTSGWFFNLTDNSGLDQNQHTVFGRVIAGGIDVLRFINQSIDTIDLRLVTGQQGLLDTTPLVRSPLSTLSGTSSLTLDSNVVQGLGTQFTTELQVGSVIIDPFDNQLIVTSITSDTEMTVDLEASRTETGVPFTLLNLPADDDYVLFSNIGEILDQI